MYDFVAKYVALASANLNQRQFFLFYHLKWGAFDSAKNHKRQRRKRQSVALNEKSRKRQSSYRLG